MEPGKEGFNPNSRGYLDLRAMMGADVPSVHSLKVHNERSHAVARATYIMSAREDMGHCKPANYQPFFSSYRPENDGSLFDGHKPSYCANNDRPKGHVIPLLPTTLMGWGYPPFYCLL